MRQATRTTQPTLIKVVCEIQTGLNVTKAALITKQVKASNSLVTFTCKKQVAEADNIFELLSLGMVQGDLAVISICGEDSEDTLSNIVGLLTSISNPISPDVFNRAA